MKLSEIFDTDYALEFADPDISSAIKTALKKTGINSSMIYQAVEDPKQIFVVAYIDGAWEVHHGFAEPGKNLVSGEILKEPKTANTKFFSTIAKLYKSRLDKSHPIRVTGTPEMWPTYKKVIDRMVADKQYRMGDVVDIVRDGRTLKSQEIHHEGTLPVLNEIMVKLK